MVLDAGNSALRELPVNDERMQLHVGTPGKAGERVVQILNGLADGQCDNSGAGSWIHIRHDGLVYPRAAQPEAKLSRFYGQPARKIKFGQQRHKWLPGKIFIHRLSTALPKPIIVEDHHPFGAK